MTATRAGAGTGTITSSPAGINCGADCAEIYDHGTVIALTATPGAGPAFAGWSGGGCTGTGTCVVTLTAATTVTATFAICPTGTTTFNSTGALQTFTVPACVTSVTIDAFGAQGGASTGESGGQNFTGGLSARARGAFTVTGGTVLNVLVGGTGGNGSCGAGGGGGSFVDLSGFALVVAGGGGFHCNAIGGVNGIGGNITTSGGSGMCGTLLPRFPTASGSSGNGASSFFGGGGGGFLSAGTSSVGAAGGGGAYPDNGGSIGGGFGGSGGRFNSCCGGSGGGGGYSGAVAARADLRNASSTNDTSGGL